MPVDPPHTSLETKDTVLATRTLLAPATRQPFRWARCAAALSCLLASMVCSAAGSEDFPEPKRPRVGLGLSFSFTLPTSNEPTAELAHEPGDLLVLWDTPQEADTGLELMASRYGQRPQQVLPLVALVGVVARFQLRDTPSALALRDRIRAEQPSWVTDLNARSTLQGEASPASAAPRLFALQQLQLATPAALPTAAPSALKLGVIDAALDPALPLAVSQKTLRSLLAVGEVPAPIDHGNTIAQLIAGVPQAGGFSGAAAGMQLYWAGTVRLAGGRASSHSFNTIAALEWLMTERVNLINLSLGGPGDAVLEAIFIRLRDKPVLLVAAAGNNGPAAPPVYPAAYPGVLAVTAIDADTQPYARANYGAYISLAAPGVDVWVPARPGLQGADGGTGQYQSGTSFATALVTGALASADTSLWRQPKAQQLEGLCHTAKDLGLPGRDAVFGCGLLNIGALDTQHAAR